MTRFAKIDHIAKKERLRYGNNLRSKHDSIYYPIFTQRFGAFGQNVSYEQYERHSLAIF